MKHHYLEVVRATECAVDRYLAFQVRDPQDSKFGGISNADGLVEVHTTLGVLTQLVSVYTCPESRYYQNASIRRAMTDMLVFLPAAQRPNGTVDCLTSNFFTTPSFEMHAFGRAMRMCNMYLAKEDQSLCERMFDVYKRYAEGLYNGGFHTPNHRWVESAGLLMAYNLTGVEKYKQKAELYLAEGMDIDENGEFTERSPGMYNGVNDNALLMIAQEGNMAEIYKPLQMNMDLLFGYMEPDHTIFTQNSRRKDKGEGAPHQQFFADSYYHIYLWAGLVLDEPRYTGFADEIFDWALRAGRGVPSALWLFQMMPELKTHEPKRLASPESYAFFHAASGIARKRAGDFSVSVLTGNPNFLFIQKGSLKCYLRMCASYFGKGQFVPDCIEQTKDGYRLTQLLEADYRWPFEEAQPTSDWHQMDHSKRKRVNSSTLKYVVDIVPGDDGVTVHLKTEGCDKVPFKLEMCVSPGGWARGEQFHSKAVAGQGLAVSGAVQVQQGVDALVVRDFFLDHHYYLAMHGGIGQNKDAFSLYATAYTHVDKTIHIGVKR